jgi:hypothetical protein
MSDVIISVEHLSKRYRLGEIGATTLRESAERWWHKVRGRNPDEHMGKVGAQRRPKVTELQSRRKTDLPLAENRKLNTKAAPKVNRGPEGFGAKIAKEKRRWGRRLFLK